MFTQPCLFSLPTNPGKSWIFSWKFDALKVLDFFADKTAGTAIVVCWSLKIRVPLVRRRDVQEADQVVGAAVHWAADGLGWDSDQQRRSVSRQSRYVLCNLLPARFSFSLILFVSYNVYFDAKNLPRKVGQFVNCQLPLEVVAADVLSFLLHIYESCGGVTCVF